MLSRHGAWPFRRDPASSHPAAPRRALLSVSSTRAIRRRACSSVLRSRVKKGRSASTLRIPNRRPQSRRTASWESVQPSRPRAGLYHWAALEGECPFRFPLHSRVVPRQHPFTLRGEKLGKLSNTFPTPNPILPTPRRFV